MQSNKTRIDSLSQEIVLLKRMFTDSAYMGRNVVIYNYGTNASTPDTTVSRINSENDYLIQELAKTQLELSRIQYTDSLLFAEDMKGKKGKSKDINERRSEKQAEINIKQTGNNQDDLEKELKRIRKQMT
ncbi:MAG: hypothetical protein IPP71_16880, partial [Bacteroidetes bacterium]|nr:hypothetical protein [Bacteroidota bacterium]